MYPQLLFILIFSRFGAVQYFTQLVKMNLVIYNFIIFERKNFFRVWGTPAEEKIDFELFLINQGKVLRVEFY